MRTKSRSVRRNSCGYELQDDVLAAADHVVGQADPPIHELEDLGSDVDVLSPSPIVSIEPVVREDVFGPFFDMHRPFVPDRGLYGINDTGVRMTRGITINEPDSYCGPAASRSQPVPPYVDYLGKGKRKVDDMSPVSYDTNEVIYTERRPPLSPPVAASTAYGSESRPNYSTVGTTLTSTPPPTVPLPSTRARLSPSVDASTSYGSYSRPNNPTVDAPGISASQPTVPFPSARRHVPRRATSATGTRRSQTSLPIPERNVGGAPATYDSLGAPATLSGRLTIT